MRRLVILAIVCVTAVAHAAPYSVEIPPGFVEQPAEIVQPRFAELRAMKGVRSVDAKIYASASGVELTVTRWRMKLDGRPRRANLAAFERGVVNGAKKSVTKHISDSHSFTDRQLVAAAIDEVDNVRVYQERRYAVDADDVVHVLSVTCVGPADNVDLESCRSTMATMRLSVLTARSIEDAGGGYMFGYIGGASIMLLLLALALRKARRG